MYSERLCFALNMSIKQISNPSYYSILTMKKKTEIDFLWKQGDSRISKTDLTEWEILLQKYFINMWPKNA